MSLAQLTPLETLRILAPLGVGRAGEVYGVRDRQLDPTVAIEVVPNRFADPAELRERFEHGARRVGRDMRAIVSRADRGRFYGHVRDAAPQKQ